MKAGLFFLLFVSSINAKVYLYQQWHLLPKVDSTDIQKSKRHPQYKNQYFIFTHLDGLITNGKVKTVISEGCEGEIDKTFPETFNGWNYQKLNEHLNLDYADILTLVPLKLEVKFKDKLKTVCGDDLAMIKKHGLAFSDVRGYWGYFSRFKQFKDKPEKAKAYLKVLEETEKRKINNPLEYTRTKALENLRLVKEFIVKRNNVFIETIKKNKAANPAVIIGSLHMQDLMVQLKNQKIDFELVPVQGLPKNSNSLIDQLEVGLRR